MYPKAFSESHLVARHQYSTAEIEEFITRLGNNDPGLTHLFLGKQESLTDEHIVKLMGALVNNISLRELCLSDHKINDETAGVIASFLINNRVSALRDLSLHDNQITDAGAKILATGLAATSFPLRHVDLSGNSFGVAGAAAILCAAAENSLLFLVNVAYTGRGDHSPSVEMQEIQQRINELLVGRPWGGSFSLRP